MLFEPIEFDQLNEQDVREEIIAPLLRQLGYKSGTVNSIIREQSLSLRYPRVYLGRKKQKDPFLRGKADYICEVDKSIRWVVEAKSPSEEMGDDHIEQAYTYANHPEVRAIYFCLCNGRELRVYRTNLGPDNAPILFIPYNEFDKKFDVIENLLSPIAIRRDYLDHAIDVGKPLGPGLRSVVRVTGGHIEYKSNNWNIPALNGLIITITSGAIERNADDYLIAFIKTLCPFSSLQRLNEKIGLDEFEASSTDNVLSTDANSPTLFIAKQQVLLPEGEPVLDLLNWTETTFAENIACDAETTAAGVLADNVFGGLFSLRLIYSSIESPVEINGTFALHLA